MFHQFLYHLQKDDKKPYQFFYQHPSLLKHFPHEETYKVHLFVFDSYCDNNIYLKIFPYKNLNCWLRNHHTTAVDGIPNAIVLKAAHKRKERTVRGHTHASNEELVI